MPVVMMAGEFCQVLSVTLGREVTMRMVRLAFERPNGLARPKRMSGGQYLMTAEDLESAIQYFEARQAKRASRQSEVTA